MFPRTEMLDLIVIDGQARGIVTRDLITGKIEIARRPTRWCSAPAATATSIYLSTNAKGCNVTAIWRAYKHGALFANPCFTQIHPTCIPVSGDYQSKLTLMSESLRNDGRIWVPLKKGDKRAAQPDSRKPSAITTWSASIRASATWCRATWPRATPRRSATKAAASARPASASIWISRDAIQRLGAHVIKERYGNLFDMYERITGEDPYKVPMRIYPAIHYTMGGLWVDYNLMSTIPGLFVIGEANFSDHGANRLGASALMQGLADGYFILPYTIGDYLAQHQAGKGRHVARRSSATPKRNVASHDQAAAGDQGHAHGGFVPSRAGQADVGILRHVAQRRRA